ncbi:MAG: NAD(P)H nitroreductase [Pseudomonadales bacterium]
MQAIDLLHNRVSTPALMEPAPSAEQLEVMFQAAARAPDHANLRPWRMIVTQGEGLVKMGELFLEATHKLDPAQAEAKEARLLNMPLRAPMIITVVASIVEHPKVPELEQLITAGCAAHAMELAAYAQGLGAMWRSGDLMFDANVKAGLGLSESEQIVGFLYLGTPKTVRQACAVDSTEFVSHWPAAL